ncbi:MAG: CopG family transcriptional regulator [Acidimicrobiales bacterium]
MRTTVTFDDDTAAAIEQLRRERDAGVSEVVNYLVRRGMAHRVARERFVQRSSDLRALIDLRNTAEVLDLLESSADH